VILVVEWERNKYNCYTFLMFGKTRMLKAIILVLKDVAMTNISMEKERS
jgi:hypothetical protein